jgi:hypothetical protein
VPSSLVIPAKAGIQFLLSWQLDEELDSSVRWNDELSGLSPPIAARGYGALWPTSSARRPVVG